MRRDLIACNDDVRSVRAELEIAKAKLEFVNDLMGYETPLGDLHHASKAGSRHSDTSASNGLDWRHGDARSVRRRISQSNLPR
jgi:hypothetical protein